MLAAPKKRGGYKQHETWMLRPSEIWLCDVWYIDTSVSEASADFIFIVTTRLLNTRIPELPWKPQSSIRAF
jgi:hypothetical protein